jgi:hypothetical protein
VVNRREDNEGEDMKEWRSQLDMDREIDSDLAIVDEEIRSEAQVHVLGTAQPLLWEAGSGLGDAYANLQQTRLDVEVEDGIAIQVALNDSNSAAVLDATQRLREYRERERLSVPPTYNFGGDVSWGGGDW